MQCEHKLPLWEKLLEKLSAEVDSLKNVTGIYVPGPGEIFSNLTVI
jgi:hypothetical protein